MSGRPLPIYIHKQKHRVQALVPVLVKGAPRSLSSPSFSRGNNAIRNDYEAKKLKERKKV